MRKESGIKRPGGGSSSKLITTCANWLSIALQMLSTPLCNSTTGSKDFTICAILRGVLHSKTESQNLLTTQISSHYASFCAKRSVVAESCHNFCTLASRFCDCIRLRLISRRMTQFFRRVADAQSQLKISYLSVCGAVHNPVVGTPIPLSPSRIPSSCFSPYFIYKTKACVLRRVRFA
jgi:hypothetical protein